MSEIKLDGYCGLNYGCRGIYRLSEKARQTRGKAKWKNKLEKYLTFILLF